MLLLSLPECVFVCVCVCVCAHLQAGGLSTADKGLPSQVGQANCYSNGLSVRCK